LGHQASNGIDGLVSVIKSAREGNQQQRFAGLPGRRRSLAMTEGGEVLAEPRADAGETGYVAFPVPSTQSMTT
jgi:hypothetical protein